MSEEWPQVALDEILALRTAGYWGENEPTDKATERVNVVRAGDISPDGRLLGFAERWFKPREASKAVCREGDVLITASGNGLGKCYSVQPEDTVASSNFTRRLVPSPDIALGRFLYFSIQSSLGARKLLEHTATSAFPNLKPTFFADPWVLLPPIAVQHRIVDLMSHVDSHLANLRAERAALGAVMYSARMEALGSFESTATLGEVLLQARAGGTPDRNNPDYYGGGIPWLKSGEVDNPLIAGTEESITESGLASSSAWMVPANTTVLAMYGATAGAVGFTDIPMATNQAVLSLVADPEKSDARFVYHWMKFNSPRLKAAASGAAQPNLSKQVVLRETGFPNLSLQEQSEIAATLDAVGESETQLQAEESSLLMVRAVMLSELLSGVTLSPTAYDLFLSEVA